MHKSSDDSRIKNHSRDDSCKFFVIKLAFTNLRAFFLRVFLNQFQFNIFLKGKKKQKTSYEQHSEYISRMKRPASYTSLFIKWISSSLI